MAELWNGLLDGLGQMLAFFFDLVPSYGFAIILLTIAVRVLLLPLTIKQTRSMQAMQALQPRIKEVQKKFKGDRQRMSMELQKLYKEHQVNPLGGCLPLLLQLPVFFALFQVLRTAGGFAGALPGTRYLPEGSGLLGAIQNQTANFLSMNLACPPTSAGRGMVELVEGAPAVDCGGSILAAIPFYLIVLLMVGTTWYQTRQMAQTNPNQRQMQMMGRIMPIFLGFISLTIATGVLVYWVTTNVWQVVQQRIMLRQRAEPSKVLDVKAKEKAGQGSPDGEGDESRPPEGDGGSPRPQQRKVSRRARSRKKRRKR